MAETVGVGDEKLKKKKIRGILLKSISWGARVIFYLVLFFFIGMVFLTSSQSRSTFNFSGYSMYTVLTGSMNSEIPQESFVLVKAVNPNDIVLDDDITFIRTDHKIVTHRVVEIFEDYKQSGLRGFRTKGVDNPEPDTEVVYADNMIGKVVYFNFVLGMVLTWIRNRMLLLVIMVIASYALIHVLLYLKSQKNNIKASALDESILETTKEEQEFPQIELSELIADNKAEQKNAENQV